MKFKEIITAYAIINGKSFNITAEESLIASMFTKKDAEYYVSFFKEYNVFSDKILYNI